MTHLQVEITAYDMQGLFERKMAILRTKPCAYRANRMIQDISCHGQANQIKKASKEGLTKINLVQRIIDTLIIFLNIKISKTIKKNLYNADENKLS